MSYSHDSSTVTVHQWQVHANTSGELSLGDFNRAVRAAETAYREERYIPSDQPISDDALLISGQSDGSVVISYTIRNSLPPF